MGEGQREGDTESEAGSRLWAVSTEPDAGLKPTDCEIMTWAEVGRLTDWATQAALWYEVLRILLFLKILLTFIHFWETERDRVQAGEGQRERETQNLKEAPGSELSAQSPTRGSNSRTARSWPGWSRPLNRLSHPGTPYPAFKYYENKAESQRNQYRCLLSTVWPTNVYLFVRLYIYDSF